MAVFIPEACYSLRQLCLEQAKASCLPSSQSFREGVEDTLASSTIVESLYFKSNFLKKTSLLKSKNIQAVNCEKLGILKLRNLEY